MRKVYLDNNATTPLHPQVKQVMMDNLDLFGNASSQHFFGQAARKAVEDARKQVAALINAHPDEIVFTSCGSESNNLVIKGVTCQDVQCKSANAHPGKHISELDLSQLIKNGLDGIEVVHPAHDEKLRAYYRGLVNQYFLLESGGSDFHGGKKNDDHTLGAFTVPMHIVETMRSRLFS